MTETTHVKNNDDEPIPVDEFDMGKAEVLDEIELDAECQECKYMFKTKAEQVESLGFIGIRFEPVNCPQCGGHTFVGWWWPPR